MMSLTLVRTLLILYELNELGHFSRLPKLFVGQANTVQPMRVLGFLLRERANIFSIATDNSHLVMVA